MLLLGLSGSLRTGSHNRRLLRAAALRLPPGADLLVWDGLADVPPFSEDLEGDAAPPPIRHLRDALAVSDGVLISTPEYNGSIPGQLKNALDWVSRPLDSNPLRGRPVAVVGASTGLFGAVWAQADLRRVLGVMGAAVIDDELPVGQADAAFGVHGELADPDLETGLDRVLGALLEAVSARSAPWPARAARAA